MDTKLMLRSALTAAALLAAVVAAPVQAATLTLNLDYEFSGAQSPQGPSPWLTAMFDDSIGGPNTVRLTMSATGLVGSENVTGWYFNFDPTLDASLLSYSLVGIPGSTPNITGSNNTYKADGDGFFDVLFDFPPPPGGGGVRFTAGETVVYDITYTSAIDVNSFNYFSVMGGGTGTYLSAAHVQSIADPTYCDGSTTARTGACGSGWIGAVPVPAAVWLFGSGLLGLVGVARRKRS